MDEEIRERAQEAVKEEYPGGVYKKYFEKLAREKDKRLFHEVKIDGEDLVIDTSKNGQITNSCAGEDAEALLTVLIFNGIGDLGEAKTRKDSSYEAVLFDCDNDKATVVISDFGKTSKYLKEHKLACLSFPVEEKIQEKRNLIPNLYRKVCRDEKRSKRNSIIAQTAVVMALMTFLFGYAIKTEKAKDPNYNPVATFVENLKERSIIDWDKVFAGNTYDASNPKDSPEEYGGEEGVARIAEATEDAGKSTITTEDGTYTVSTDYTRG